MALNLTMFVCLCVERHAMDENQKNVEPKIVVSSGPVIVEAPAQ